MTYMMPLFSVQGEFVNERKALADYIQKDAMFGIMVS